MGIVADWLLGKTCTSTSPLLFALISLGRCHCLGGHRMVRRQVDAEFQHILLRRPGCTGNEGPRAPAPAAAAPQEIVCENIITGIEFLL